MTHYGPAPTLPTPQRRWTDRPDEPIPHRPNVSSLTEVLVPEFMIWLGDRALTPTPVCEARMRELVGVWRDRERRGIRVVRRDVLVCRSEWAEVSL